MGVLAPVFVILLIPEFWKNRSSGSEAVSYTHLDVYKRQKRQLSSLQGILAAKNKEVVSLHAQLIERDVLLKQAAVCISEAISLCRQQADHTKEAHNFLKDYETNFLNEQLQ